MDGQVVSSKTKARGVQVVVALLLLLLFGCKSPGSKIHMTTTTEVISIASAADDLQITILPDGQYNSLEAPVGPSQNYISDWFEVSGTVIAYRKGFQYSLATAPPTFTTSTGETFLSEAIRVKQVTLDCRLIGGLQNGTFRVYLLNDPQPANFGPLNIPGPIPTSSADYSPNPAIDANYGSYIDVSPVVAGVNTPVNNTDYLGGIGHVIPLDPRGFNQVIRDNGGQRPWNGKFHLAVVAEGEWSGYPGSASYTPGTKLSGTIWAFGLFGFANYPPILNVEYAQWHTGFMSTRQDRTRMVRDHRLGFPAASADLVEDGYLPGIWVHAYDYDPPDPVEEHGPAKPSRREGIIDKKGVR